MKKFLFCLTIFILFQPVYAEDKIITGGVTYNVDSAREYLFKDIPNVEISKNKYFLHADNVERMIYSYDTNQNIIGITVLYKQDKTQAYIYDAQNILMYVDKYDKDVNLYPHRGYRYSIDGKLILTTLSVSKNEHFRFNPNGKLIAHSINNITYDENGQIIGTFK